MVNSAELANAQAKFKVVELRQYTLHSGRREELILLFESNLLEPQETAGMTVLGQFVDLDDPNRFVWLRGFDDMTSRTQALTAFYDGPVWIANRIAANATMVDSDNVLLLRPAPGHAPPAIESWTRPPPTTGGLLALICQWDRTGNALLAQTFPSALASALVMASGTLAGCYVTNDTVDTFKRLPVRQGEQVIVWLARFDQLHDANKFAAVLLELPVQSTDSGVRQVSNARPLAGIVWPPQVLRLAPTRASRF